MNFVLKLARWGGDEMSKWKSQVRLGRGRVASGQRQQQQLWQTCNRSGERVLALVARSRECAGSKTTTPPPPKALDENSNVLSARPPFRASACLLETQLRLFDPFECSLANSCLPKQHVASACGFFIRRRRPKRDGATWPATPASVSRCNTATESQSVGFRPESHPRRLAS